MVTEIIRGLLKPRTIITFAMFGTLVYCIVTKMEVNPILAGVVSALMTHWFDERTMKNGHK